MSGYIPECPHWRLRLSHNKEWQEHYTGFDPAITLPKEFSEYHCMGFLTAEARFADAVLRLLPKLEGHTMWHALREKKDDAIEPLITRAFFNTSVLAGKTGFINYLGQYMHEKSNKAISAKIRFSGEDPYQTLVERFKENLKSHKDSLSARGFMEDVVENVKPQYVEAWLLYRGQTLQELRELADTYPNFPPEHKATIEAVWNAYNESGLATHVDRLRKWADSPIAQGERRIKVDRDMGPIHGVIPVGALDTGVRITPKSEKIGRGT